MQWFGLVLAFYVHHMCHNALVFSFSDTCIEKQMPVTGSIILKNQPLDTDGQSTVFLGLATDDTEFYLEKLWPPKCFSKKNKKIILVVLMK